MIVNVATLKSYPGKEKELEEVLKNLIGNVKQEQGTVVYNIHRAQDDPGVFLFYEMYEDQASLKHHASTPYFKEYREKTADLVAERNMTFYEIIASIDK